MTSGNLLLNNSNLLSTESISAREKFDYWNDIVCEEFVHLDCQTKTPQAFSGAIASNTLGDIKISEVQSQAQTVARTPRQIAKVAEDQFIVNLQLMGKAQVSQGKKCEIISPGELVLHDSTKPFQLSFESHFKQLVLQIPRKSLLTALPDVEDIAGSIVNKRSGSGCILANFLQNVALQLNILTLPERTKMSGTIVQLLALSFSGKFRRANTASQATPIKTALRKKIEKFIITNLTEYNLSPRYIAERNHISLRSLHKLFESSELSLSQFILKERLEASKNMIHDPSRAVSISDVAFSSGFSDLSHFSKVFKRRFGVSPREYKKSIEMFDTR